MVKRAKLIIILLFIIIHLIIIIFNGFHCVPLYFFTTRVLYVTTVHYRICDETFANLFFWYYCNNFNFVLFSSVVFFYLWWGSFSSFYTHEWCSDQYNEFDFVELMCKWFSFGYVDTISVQRIISCSIICVHKC